MGGDEEEEESNLPGFICFRVSEKLSFGESGALKRVGEKKAQRQS